MIGTFSYGDVIFIVVVSVGTALLVYFANRTRKRRSNEDKHD